MVVSPTKISKMNRYLLPCGIYNFIAFKNNESIKKIEFESVFQIVNWHIKFLQQESPTEKLFISDVY